MDFVADALFDGRRLRTLPFVDNYTSECLVIDVGHPALRRVGTVLVIVPAPRLDFAFCILLRIFSNVIYLM